MRRARNRKYLYLCHMSKKQKYYVVWAGVMPGIYDSWTDCQLQTKGYDGAQFKSFDTLEEAEHAFASSPYAYIGQKLRQQDVLRRQPEMIVNFHLKS